MQTHWCFACSETPSSGPSVRDVQSDQSNPRATQHELNIKILNHMARQTSTMSVARVDGIMPVRLTCTTATQTFCCFVEARCCSEYQFEIRSAAGLYKESGGLLHAGISRRGTRKRAVTLLCLRLRLSMCILCIPHLFHNQSQNAAPQA
jgi:hypothetical protein